MYPRQVSMCVCIVSLVLTGLSLQVPLTLGLPHSQAKHRPGTDSRTLILTDVCLPYVVSYGHGGLIKDLKVITFMGNPGCTSEPSSHERNGTNINSSNIHPFFRVRSM